MNFNSIKVRLEPVYQIHFFLPFSYFNSIKVRLEHNEKIRYYAVGE